MVWCLLCVLALLFPVGVYYTSCGALGGMRTRNRQWVHHEGSIPQPIEAWPDRQPHIYTSLPSTGWNKQNVFRYLLANNLHRILLSSVVRVFTHGAMGRRIDPSWGGPIELFLVPEPFLLIGKSSPCGGSGFPLSLSQWSFTICLTPYNRK